MSWSWIESPTTSPCPPAPVRRPRTVAALRAVAVLFAGVLAAGCGTDGGETSTSPQPGVDSGAESAAASTPRTASGPASPVTTDPSAAAAAAPATPIGPLAFEDVTDAAGLRFLHDPSPSAALSYPEIIGSGVAVLDYDGDGHLDVYLVQGGRIPGTAIGTPMPNRLFRNDGTGRFVDVTDAAGDAGDTGFGMGALAVDLEGDGDQDLFITNVGRDTLLRNDGDGTFTDITESAGVGGGDAYSLGAAFLDYDGDGDLDLYVTGYVVWRPGIDPECFSPRGTPDYCGPANYRGGVDRLYRNRGDGTFEDVSREAGIDGVATRSMGVVAFDFDGDGWEDLFVANDGEPNLLWHNRGDGTFVDDAAILGCAVNADGLAEASMGVAVADVDDDGDFDLLCTHLVGETHTFYRNDDGWFTDATTEAGLAGWSRPDTGFAVAWSDLDHDGDEDLVVANGAVMLPLQPRDPERPYAEPDRVVTGEGARWSEPVALPDPGGRATMGRGLAIADLDGDGASDLLFTSNRGPAQLLRNRTGDVGPWIGVRLMQPGANRDALGAVVSVSLGDRTETRLVRPHRGFLSSHDPVVRVGLGARDDTSVDVRVRWPDGSRERFAARTVGRVHELIRGTGIDDDDERQAAG